MSTIFQDIFDAWSESDHIAVIDNETAISYRALLSSARELAGVISPYATQGCTIAISANHGLPYIRGLLAAILCDSLIVPVNPSATLTEKLHILENSNASILLLEEKESLWGKEKLSSHGLTLFSSLKPHDESTCNNLGRMLIYTSGTTSKPKGVVLSDDSLTNNIKAVANDFGLCPGDRTIIFSPPAYAMAMTQIFSYLWAGGMIVCWPMGMRFPAALIEAIEKYKLTGLTLSPSAARVVRKFVNLDSRDFTSLRYVSSGGMPLYVKDLLWYRQVFANARVINFYGCTENSPRISHYWTPLNINAASTTPLPVGKPLAGVEIKIVTINGSPVPTNSVGEICLRGSSLMRGYWKNEAFMEAKFNDGWFKTGDSGFFDDEGNLNLCGRVDNVFSVGHEKVAPEEVEAVISQLTGVDEVVLCRTADALLDSAPIALVVTHAPLEKLESTIIRECKRQLSTAKVPRRVLFTTEIPKTTYGKIDRRASQALADSIIEATHAA